MEREPAEGIRILRYFVSVSREGLRTPARRPRLKKYSEIFENTAGY